MWYKIVGTSFFRFVTIHAFDRQTDGRKGLGNTVQYMQSRGKMRCNGMSFRVNFDVWHVAVADVRGLYRQTPASVKQVEEMICGQEDIPRSHKNRREIGACSSRRT